MSSAFCYWLGSKSLDSPSSNSESDRKAECDFPPGTQIRRPIETVISKTTKDHKISFAYHYSIVIGPNLIIELTDSNTHSIACINLKKSKYTAVHYPKDKNHAIEIIKRALSKYKTEAEYDVINYNCEHFANFCYFGAISSDQVDRVMIHTLSPTIGSALGVAIAAIKHFNKACNETKVKVAHIRKWIPDNCCDCCWKGDFLKNGKWIGPLSDHNMDKSFTLDFIENQYSNIGKKFVVTDELYWCFLQRANGNYTRYIMYGAGIVGAAFASLYWFDYMRSKSSAANSDDYYNMNEDTIVDIKVALKMYDKTQDRDELVKESLKVLFGE